MSRFSERFKSLRLSRHLSQQELANQLGSISKSSVNMYERGEREPSFETLEAIADYFNVDMDYLLGNSDNPNKYGDLMAYLNEEYRRTIRTGSSTDIQNEKIKSNLSNIEIGGHCFEDCKNLTYVSITNCKVGGSGKGIQCDGNGAKSSSVLQKSSSSLYQAITTS